MSPLVEPQPRNRFVSFVRASGRGEAKLCGRARGDKIVVLGLLRVSFGPPPAAPPGVSVPAPVVRGQPYKTNVKSLFFADNLVKPMQTYYFRGQPCKTNVKHIIFRGQPCTTNVKTTFFADNLVKPM